MEYGELKACFSAGGKQLCSSTIWTSRVLEYSYKQWIWVSTINIGTNFCNWEHIRYYVMFSLYMNALKHARSSRHQLLQNRNWEQIPFRNARCYKHDYSNNVYCLNIYQTFHEIVHAYHKNEKRGRNGTGQKSNETRNVTCCSHNNYMLNVFYLMIQYQGESGLIDSHAYSILLLPITICKCQLQHSHTYVYSAWLYC